MMMDYKDKFKVIRNQVKDGSITKDNAKEQTSALKEAMQAEVDALLTDQQKAQIDQYRADRDAKHKVFRDSSKAVMVSALSMSEDQVLAYDATKQEAKDAASVLFEQSKNGDIDRESLRASLKLLFSDRNDKLEALFDVKQLDIIKIHKALTMRMKKHRSSKGKKGGRSKG